MHAQNIAFVFRIRQIKVNEIVLMSLLPRSCTSSVNIPAEKFPNMQVANPLFPDLELKCTKL